MKSVLSSTTNKTTFNLTHPPPPLPPGPQNQEQEKKKNNLKSTQRFLSTFREAEFAEWNQTTV